MAWAKTCRVCRHECVVRWRLCALNEHVVWVGLVMNESWLLFVRGCVHGSLDSNYIGPEGGAAIAGALRHVPSLTQLEYVVGEGASLEAAGCVG